MRRSVTAIRLRRLVPRIVPVGVDYPASELIGLQMLEAVVGRTESRLLHPVTNLSRTRKRLCCLVYDLHAAPDRRTTSRL